MLAPLRTRVRAIRSRWGRRCQFSLAPLRGRHRCAVQVPVQSGTVAKRSLAPLLNAVQSGTVAERVVRVLGWIVFRRVGM